MGSFSGSPPLSTDSGATPAPDVPPVNVYSPESAMNDQLNFAKAHIDDLRSITQGMSEPEKVFAELLIFLAKVIGDIWIYVLRVLVTLQANYNNALTDLHTSELKVGIPAARDMTADELSILIAALGSTATANYEVPGSDITQEGEDLYNSFIEPFALWGNTEDISKFGSGFANAKFLLKRAMTLSLAEYTLDSMKNLVGFGWVKQIQPLIGFVDRAINPSNVVRMSMEQAYSYLMKAPMQRDLNHLYPIKDLGVTALCKLYLRKGIDEQTYLDKCLDAGLNNQWAQQLILETAKLISESDIAKLLNNKYITEPDAKAQLLEQGYPEWQADAKLYLEQNSRYFSYQERVGGEAVTAWKHGYIDQTQLEDLLHQLNFTDKEISLLEIEGQFTKSSTDRKTLSYSNVKSMFEANIVDLDYVITYLTNDGYSPDDVTKLVLLDFVKAEDRALKQQELIARIRVQAETELASAATEANKNETALADARKQLAAELDSVQKQMGLLQSLPSVMDLIGIALP